MKVSLIAHTPSPLLTISSAAAITRGITVDQVMNWSNEQRENLVRKCYESGHWSVFEFADFDFEVQRVSRVFETQAVRSRMASFEWETGRRDQGYLLAATLENNPIFSEYMQKEIEMYERAVKDFGYKPEEARYVLPQGVARKGRIKRNFRNLMETAHVRLCSKTQEEYRQFMNECKSIVTSIDPFLGSLLTPKCMYYGYCNEENGCGKKLSKLEVLSAGNVLLSELEHKNKWND